MTSQASYTITAVKDGNDLDSVLMLWKKTSTNAAPAKPSGTNLNGWTVDMPEFESGAFVWTCNRVAISDPTASTPTYIYTDPVLDTHWQKLDELYKQGTEIKNTVDNITLKYYNTNGEETSFKLTNGAIDITLLKNQVDAAAKTATNFISMRTDGGIEVGNKSGGNWTGYRSQMLADSFNILDRNGDFLAKYGSNTVDLGLNKEDSEIRFCDGLLSLKYDADYSAASLTSDGNIRIFGGNEGIVDIGIIHEESAGLKYSTGLTSTYLGCGISASEGDDFSVDVWSDIWLKHDGTGYWDASSSIEITAPTLKIRGQTIASAWCRGRENAILASTNNANNGVSYYPLIDVLSYTGDWSVGTLANNLNVVYTSDSDYAAGNYTKKWLFAASDGSFTAPGDLVSGGHIYTPGMGGGWIQMKNNNGTYRMVLGLTNATSDVYLGLGSYNASEGKTYVMAGKELMLQARGAVYLGAYTGGGYGRVIIGAQASDRGLELKPETNNTCSLGWGSGRWKYAYIRDIYATYAVHVDSDRRLKKDISYDLSSLDKVIDLIKPATYKLIADDQELIRFGFIAQDAEQAFIDAGLNPDDYAFISKDETENGVMLSLGYTETNALLWHRQQQLEQRIAELEKRIA